MFPPPTLSPRERKQVALELSIARVDPILHALRVEWRTDFAVLFTKWPAWISPDEVAAELATLARLAATPPKLPALDRAVAAYAARMTKDAARLAALVERDGAEAADAGAPRPSWDELEPVFERLGQTSHALLVALREARPAEAAPGSRLAVHRACFAAAMSLAELPGSQPIAERARPSVFVRPAREELAGRARACVRAAAATLDDGGEFDQRTTDLAFSVGAQLRVELDRMHGPRYHSQATLIAQVAGYLAAHLREP